MNYREIVGRLRDLQDETLAEYKAGKISREALFTRTRQLSNRIIEITVIFQ